MRGLTEIIVVAALGAAVAAPVSAAPLASLVDEIKRTVVIHDPADRTLQHLTFYSLSAGT